VLIKTDAQGNKTYYVYGLGLIGQEDSAGNYLAYHFDRRGSTIALTDINGKITDAFQYGPYGELVNHTGSAETPFLYNGQDGVITDANGLYYMRARYYDTDIKRFINQDVLLGNINNDQSLDRFAYVDGKPVTFIDPSGLSPWSDISSWVSSEAAPTAWELNHTAQPLVRFLNKPSLWVGAGSTAVALVSGAASAVVDTPVTVPVAAAVTTVATVSGEVNLITSASMAWDNPSAENKTDLAISAVGVIPGLGMTELGKLTEVSEGARSAYDFAGNIMNAPGAYGGLAYPGNTSDINSYNGASYTWQQK